MTVKDLKAKLSNIPEEASVEIVMCANDNPLSDGCRVNSVCYFEWLQRTAGRPWFCSRRERSEFHERRAERSDPSESGLDAAE